MDDDVREECVEQGSACDDTATDSDGVVQVLICIGRCNSLWGGDVWITLVLGGVVLGDVRQDSFLL